MHSAGLGAAVLRFHQRCCPGPCRGRDCRSARRGQPAGEGGHLGGALVRKERCGRVVSGREPRRGLLCPSSPCSGLRGCGSGRGRQHQRHGSALEARRNLGPSARRNRGARDEFRGSLEAGRVDAPKSQPRDKRQGGLLAGQRAPGVQRPRWGLPAVEHCAGGLFAKGNRARAFWIRSPTDRPRRRRGERQRAPGRGIVHQRRGAVKSGLSTDLRRPDLPPSAQSIKERGPHRKGTEGQGRGKASKGSRGQAPGNPAFRKNRCGPHGVHPREDSRAGQTFSRGQRCGWQFQAEGRASGPILPCGEPRGLRSRQSIHNPRGR